MRHLYALYCDGHYKFGLASDPEKRKDTMQTGNPKQIKLINYNELVVRYSGEPKDNFNCRFHENMVHAFLRPYRERGEWFKESPVTESVALLLNQSHLWVDMVLSEMRHQLSIEDDEIPYNVKPWIEFWCTDFTCNQYRADDGGLPWRTPYPAFIDDFLQEKGKLSPCDYYSENYKQALEYRERKKAQDQ